MFSSVRRSISRKFMTAVMATTFVAVLVSGLANLAYDIHDYKNGVVADLTSQADLLAQVSLAAIEFDDHASAQGALDQLKSRPGVRAAAIYRADDTLFASYLADRKAPDAGLPAHPGLPGILMKENDVRVYKLIERGGEKIGTIYLHASYPLDGRLGRNIKLLIAIVLVSLMIAAVVSLWLQSAVTKPVGAVTHAVRELISRRDFSQRVNRTTEDETGVLVDAFNSMLEEVGKYAALLEASNSSLTHEVEQRIKADEALHELNASLEQRIIARSLELERANEQLRHSQKMEAIGQLTGGVAHDFNNVLQVIAGNLQLLSMSMPADATAQRRIETAKFATDRGAKLSAQLLAFARKQPLQPAPTNLGRLLRDIDDMLRRALGEGIEIETIVAAGLWNTLVDPNQIENVILNLAINARDAMQGQGNLTLELGNATLDDQYLAQENEIEAGQYVMLAISDTGAGMPREVVARAFEPFFTTKREGEGTGLGLSMAFGFVKQSNGHIKIYSEVGCGTTIRIYLPRSVDQELRTFDVTVGRVVGGTETLLVVEDDLAVQSTAVDMLTQLGYRVLKANDGASALKIIESGAQIDMLFTDVVMPGPVRSPDLAKRAKVLLPEISVLFTSGYTQNAIVHGGRLDPGVELISKPYRRDELARKIRHVFANTQHGISLREEAAAVVQHAPAAGGLRLLVVEDNPDNLMILMELLSLLGHEATGAPSAEEAALLFRKESFDVLLTDLHLPGMSGLDLAAQLRVLAPELAVIVSSGAADLQERLLLAGYHHLPKPYFVEALEQVLGTCMA